MLTFEAPFSAAVDEVDGNLVVWFNVNDVKSAIPVIATSWNLAPVTLTEVKLSLSSIVKSNALAETVTEVKLGLVDIVISPASPVIVAEVKLAKPVRLKSPLLPAAWS